MAPKLNGEGAGALAAGVGFKSLEGPPGAPPAIEGILKGDGPVIGFGREGLVVVVKGVGGAEGAKLGVGSG